MKYLIAGFLALVMSAGLNTARAEEANYLLGPGDVLKITVYNNPDLSLETRVTEGGTLSFPLVGEMKVGGLTPAAAEKMIADALETGGFVKQPQVNVLVSAFQSALVSVLGSVYKPGRYPLDRATSLAEILAQAGGATPDGSDLVTIVGKNGKKEYDLGRVIDKGDAEQNVAIAGGDIIYVHAHDVAVMGQVLRPGKYSVVGSVRTVADFLSMAGGIVPTTGSDTVTVTTVRDGKINHFDVDVDTLFRTGDNSANIELVSGDMIYVPRMPMVYIYGEVQRPGFFRLERNMTVMQVLAEGGGPTPRGTQRGIKLHRRNAAGVVEKISPALTDPVQADDVLYVQESLF